MNLAGRRKSRWKCKWVVGIKALYCSFLLSPPCIGRAFIHAFVHHLRDIKHLLKPLFAAFYDHEDLDHSSFGKDLQVVLSSHVSGPNSQQRDGLSIQPLPVLICEIYHTFIEDLGCMIQRPNPWSSAVRNYETVKWENERKGGTRQPLSPTPIQNWISRDRSSLTHFLSLTSSLFSATFKTLDPRWCECECSNGYPPAFTGTHRHNNNTPI